VEALKFSDLTYEESYPIDRARQDVSASDISICREYLILDATVARQAQVKFRPTTDSFAYKSAHRRFRFAL
jgi:hypothetical protein